MAGRLWTFFQREGEDTMSDYPTGYHESGESTSSRRSRRPVIAFLFVIIFLSGTFFGWTLNGLLPRAFHQTSVSQTPVEQQYPAFLVSTPPATPRAGLPYTRQTDSDHSDLQYLDDHPLCWQYRCHQSGPGKPDARQRLCSS